MVTITILSPYNLFLSTNRCIRYVPPGIDVEESSLLISLTKLLGKHPVETIIVKIIVIITIFSIVRSVPRPQSLSKKLVETIIIVILKIIVILIITIFAISESHHHHHH